MHSVLQRPLDVLTQSFVIFTQNLVTWPSHSLTLPSLSGVRTSFSLSGSKRAKASLRHSTSCTVTNEKWVLGPVISVDQWEASILTCTVICRSRLGPLLWPLSMWCPPWPPVTMWPLGSPGTWPWPSLMPGCAGCEPRDLDLEPDELWRCWLDPWCPCPLLRWWWTDILFSDFWNNGEIYRIQSGKSNRYCCFLIHSDLTKTF